MTVKIAASEARVNMQCVNNMSCAYAYYYTSVGI